MAVSTGNDGDDVMSTINITPFTDVLLVLLIIFIILAAVTKDPKMPTAKNTDLVQASQILVTVDEHNKIQIGSHVLDSVADAPAAFGKLQDETNHVFRSVIIKAAPTAEYGTVLEVMDAAKKVGLTNFGLANAPDKAKAP